MSASGPLPPCRAPGLPGRGARRRRGLLPVLLLASIAAGPLRAETARIYGIEAEAGEEMDEVLVFADAPLSPRLLPGRRGEVVVVFPDATLDRTAPRQFDPSFTAAFSRVRASEARDASPPEVRIEVGRRIGAQQVVTPEVSTDGNAARLRFPRPREEWSGPVAVGRGAGPVPARPDTETRDFRMLNTDVRQVVEKLADFVGETLIHDEELRGRISVDAPGPISRRDAAALLEAVLLYKGFVLIPTPGGIRKIVRTRNAQGPWVPSLEDDPSEAAVTTLIRLSEIDAELVKQAIHSLAGTPVLVIPHPPSNALILSGAGNRLRRLVDVIRELDALGPRRLAIFTLDHAGAEEVADAISAAHAERDLDVWPDVRTNRVIVRARPDRIGPVRALVARLDRPATGRGELQVMPIRFASVDRVAETIRTLQSGGAGTGSGLPRDLPARAVGLEGRELRVAVHGPSHALVVQADPTTMDLVREVVSLVDRAPARVDVEVAVAEVSLDASFALGFDALLPLVEPESPDDLIAVLAANPGGTVLSDSGGESLFARYVQTPILIPLLDDMGLPQLDPTTGEPILLEVPRDGYWVTADESEARSRVLLRPKLSLLAGEEHEIFSGNNVPVLQQRPGDTAGGELTIRQNIERQDVGTTLKVSPTVGRRGDVQLAIDLTVSRLTDNAVGASVEDVGPTIRERSLSSVARLEPGRAAVIAFAALPTTVDTVRGTPFLKDVPFIGWLFRRVTKMKRNTLILVTATAEVHRPEAEVLGRWIEDELERRALAEASASAAVGSAVLGVEHRAGAGRR